MGIELFGVYVDDASSFACMAGAFVFLLACWMGYALRDVRKSNTHDEK